jgi:hypothetical protein
VRCKHKHKKLAKPVTKKISLNLSQICDFRRKFVSLGEPLGTVERDLQICDKHHKHKKLPRQHFRPSSQHLFRKLYVLGSAAAALLTRFCQAAATTAKLAAAAAALPPPRCHCLRRRRAAATTNPARLPSGRRHHQAGRRHQPPRGCRRASAAAVAFVSIVIVVAVSVAVAVDAFS